MAAADNPRKPYAGIWSNEIARLRKMGMKKETEDLHNWVDKIKAHRATSWRFTTLTEDEKDAIEQELDSMQGWDWHFRCPPVQEFFANIVYNRATLRDYDDGHQEFNQKEWEKTQRKNYAKGLLSQDTIDLINKIPGWNWNPNGLKVFA